MATNDDFLDGRQPVPVQAAVPPVREPRDRRHGEAQLVKLNRRVVTLKPGRYSVMITIGEDGLEDWTVTLLGKVER